MEENYENTFLEAVRGDTPADLASNPDHTTHTVALTPFPATNSVQNDAQTDLDLMPDRVPYLTHSGEDLSHLSFEFSLFNDKRDNTPQRVTMGMSELFDLLICRRRIEENDSESAKDGPLISGAIYPPTVMRRDGKTKSEIFDPANETPEEARPPVRCNEHVESIGLAILDFDNGTTPNQIIERLKHLNNGEGAISFIYSTWKHTEADPRLRLTLPLSPPIPAKDWPQYFRRLSFHFDGAPDQSAKDPSRMQFLPACPKEREADVYAQGSRTFLIPLDMTTLLVVSAEAPDAPKPALRQETDPYARKALENSLGQLCTITSHRNDGLIKNAFTLGGFVGAGRLQRDVVETSLLNAARSNGYIAKDGEEAARSTIRSGLDAGEREPNYKGTTRSNEPTKRVVSVGLTAADLLSTEFPEPKWIIKGFLCEGSTVLAGHPKLGKSWMALGCGVSVACGGKAFGSVPVEAGDVLYLALEDNPRRMSSRLKKVLRGKRPDGLERLHVYHDWERLNEGGLERIDTWISEHPDTRLIIIDTFQKVKPHTRRGGNAYEADYEAAAPLNELAGKWGIAIVCVHHLRKQDSADDVEAVSGSYGITGAADAILGLRRERQQCDAVLSITGRDVEECERALRWNGEFGSWELLGDAQKYLVSKERSEVIDALQGMGAPTTPKNLWESTGVGKSQNNLKTMLHRMAKDGEVVNNGGKYSLPEEVDVEEPCNPGDLSNPTPLSLEKEVADATEPLTASSDDSPLNHQADEVAVISVELSNLGNPSHSDSLEPLIQYTADELGFSNSS